MKIPAKFEEILKTNQTIYSIVLNVISSFEPILIDNKLFFFEEYTDHGIEHIEMVLKAAEFLIPDESFEHIKPKEVALIILAIILHDIGMHAEFSTFNAMIEGKYDDVRVNILDKKTWQELWQDYLSEVKHFSSKQRKNIFGHSNEMINEPDLSDKDKLTGTDKKLIGEFIRRHHARLAHEIALKGFIGNNTIPFGNENLINQDRQFAGIIARSHGMSVRDTFEYLKEIAYGVWRNPADMSIVYLMVLLRIADYLQIDKTRSDPTLLKLKTFNSPVSQQEHKTHLIISHLTFQNEDCELITVTCEPKDAKMYVKIQNLIKDIQHEFDLSWAILGETYGFLPDKKPKIKFRRITSNLEYPTFLKKIDYVPQKISFQVNNELSKLLIAPLYGNSPTYGVRELVQNATDACKERIKIEHDKGNTNYEPLVTVSIDKVDEDNYLFRIKDNGKGMTLDEILNYFLSVGSSFRSSFQWKKEFISKDGKSLVNRNGKFGIGVLAAFLLGDKIKIKTKNYNHNSLAHTFTADITSDFIDVRTIENFDTGTEIEIIMPKYIFKQLDQKENKKILWADWYIGDTPQVKYMIGNEIKNRQMFFKPSIEREIYPSGYDKIKWFYTKEMRTNSDMFVACNDIIITLSSYSNFITNGDVITYKPHLLIEDSQGNLPLNLNRNSLDSVLLPFEDDLLEDVCKDFIAQILMTQFSSDEISKYSIHPHNMEFLYLANGFSLVLDYFVNKIQNKTVLRVLTRHDNSIKNVSVILNQSENLIIYPLYRQLYYLRGQKDRIAPNVETHILLSTARYNDYFEYELRIPQWLKDKHKLQWKNDKFIAYTMNNFKSKTSLFIENEFSAIMDQIDTNIQSIQEIPINYLNVKKGGITLNRLFEKYIGDTVIIPHNMNERKKIYPLAFEELKDYMKDYMKN
jgi:hypothetical protein